MSIPVSALPLLLFPGYGFVSRLSSYFLFSKSELISQWMDVLLSISVSLSLRLSLLHSSSVLFIPLFPPAKTSVLFFFLIVCLFVSRSVSSSRPMWPTYPRTPRTWFSACCAPGSAASASMGSLTSRATHSSAGLTGTTSGLLRLPTSLTCPHPLTPPTLMLTMTSSRTRWGCSTSIRNKNTSTHHKPVSQIASVFPLCISQSCSHWGLFKT